MSNRVIALVVVLCLSNAAHAADKTFQQVDDVFHNDSYWLPFGIPTSTDRIIIPSGRKCRVTGDATVETVEIEGDLVIETGSTLTLVNHDCGLVPVCPDFNSTVNGTIELEAEGTLAFSSESHTISGIGGILAPIDNSTQADGGQITIEAGIFFRNGTATGHTAIRGAMTISGAGRFINDGTVEVVQDNAADPGDVDFLYIDVGVLEDKPGAVWLTNCMARMVFKDNACLEGDFDDVGITNGNGGSFMFDDAIVHTLGTYFREGCGEIVYAGSGEFAFLVQDTTQGCSLSTSPVSSSCDESVQYDFIERAPATPANIDCPASP